MHRVHLFPHSRYDPTGGLLNDLNDEYNVNNVLKCISYIVVILLIWHLIKINFILKPCERSDFTNPSLHAPGGSSGWYSKGAHIPLANVDTDDLSSDNPVIVKESIWGTAANWGDAETYKTTQPKTSTLGYNYANHLDLYGNTSDFTQTSVSVDFAGSNSQTIDTAGRDGYAGGRGISHREGLDNPDGDVDGDFGMYDIYATRTNTPSQPLTASQSAGRMADASGKVSIMSGPSYGMYGDVPVALYNTADTVTGDEWGLGSDKLYRMNSYTWNEDKNY